MINWSEFKGKRLIVVDPDTKGSWGLIEDGRLVSVESFSKGKKITWVKDKTKDITFQDINVTILAKIGDVDAVFVEHQFNKHREGGKLTSFYTLGKILTASSRDAKVYGVSSSEWHKLCGNFRFRIDFPDKVRVPDKDTKKDALAYALAHGPEIMRQHCSPIRGKDEVIYTQSVADVICMAHYITRKILESNE